MQEPKRDWVRLSKSAKPVHNNHADTAHLSNYYKLRRSKRTWDEILASIRNSKMR